MTDEINPEMIQEEQAESSNKENAAIDAFIDSVGLDKIKSFLRDLLVAYERGESKPAEESNPDDSTLRQATAQLARGTSSEEEPPEVEETEEEEPKRGKSVAWRNGRQVGAVGG